MTLNPKQNRTQVDSILGIGKRKSFLRELQHIFIRFQDAVSEWRGLIKYKLFSKFQFCKLEIYSRPLHPFVPVREH